MGVTYSMINKTVQENYQGTAIAIFHIGGAIAGSANTFLLGYLGDKYQAN